MPVRASGWRQHKGFDHEDGGDLRTSLVRSAARANTIASQTALLIEFAGRTIWSAKEWVFEMTVTVGVAGTSGLERVRDLAAEGQIQVVLVYAPDRSRKYAYPDFADRRTGSQRSRNVVY